VKTNGWKTGSDLVNCGIAAGEIIADPLDPMAWIAGAFDVVDLIGDVFKDIGSSIENFFDHIFGNDDEEAELNNALGSEEMASM